MKNDRTMSDFEIAALENMGWDFLPYGPEEWMWMKFDESGKRIAVQGDLVWKEDLGIAA